MQTNNAKERKKDENVSSLFDLLTHRFVFATQNNGN